jgi:hypothetical protein
MYLFISFFKKRKIRVLNKNLLEICDHNFYNISDWESFFNFCFDLAFLIELRFILTVIFLILFKITIR